MFYNIGGSGMRIETDCVGSFAIPDKALYGIHAARAQQNFPIGSEKTDVALMKNIVLIKQAAAVVNQQAGTLDSQKSRAIIRACQDVLSGKYDDQFVVAAIQGGAGTSANMNVNEVVANVAGQFTAIVIHPNDDVNQSQSTNDVFPTAGKMTLLQLYPALRQQLQRLVHVLLDRAETFKDAVKVGRTQLQDAVPTTFGNSFHAYYSLFKRDLQRVNQAVDVLRNVNLGGTAIGTGLNASEFYREHIIDEVNDLTGMKLVVSEDEIDATQNCDALAALSSSLKTLSLDLIKLSNDLRLLGSGPQAGFCELRLPAVQAGSSIMPGKVNPVIPEVVNQVAFQVIGYDTTVSLAVQAGQLELNAFEPVIFKDLIDGEVILTGALETLITRCLEGIQVNTEYGKEQVEKSAISATVLVPVIGYERAMNLIKQAIRQKKSVKTLLKTQAIMSDEQIDYLFSTQHLINRPNDKRYVKVAN